MVDPKSKVVKLTDAELALIKQLCLPNKIIARDTCLALPTIKMRIARLATKLGVETRTAIVVKAIKLKLVDIADMKERYD